MKYEPEQVSSFITYVICIIGMVVLGIIGMKKDAEIKNLKAQLELCYDTRQVVVHDTIICYSDVVKDDYVLFDFWRDVDTASLRWWPSREIRFYFEDKP